MREDSASLKIIEKLRASARSAFFLREHPSVLAELVHAVLFEPIIELLGAS